MTDFVPEPRRRPQVDALGFDHRLMTPERQLQLAGPVRLRFSSPELARAQLQVIGRIPVLWLDCEKCGKGVEPLTDDHGEAYPVTAGHLLACVLRHQVMRHGLALSGAGDGA